MIFWIFSFLILSLIVEVYLWWKLQASLIFLSGRTCTIGGWLNTFLPHCISCDMHAHLVSKAGYLISGRSLSLWRRNQTDLMFPVLNTPDAACQVLKKMHLCNFTKPVHKRLWPVMWEAFESLGMNPQQRCNNYLAKHVKTEMKQ